MYTSRILGQMKQGEKCTEYTIICCFDKPHFLAINVLFKTCSLCGQNMSYISKMICWMYWHWLWCQQSLPKLLRFKSYILEQMKSIACIIIIVYSMFYCMK